MILFVCVVEEMCSLNGNEQSTGDFWIYSKYFYINVKVLLFKHFPFFFFFFPYVNEVYKNSQNSLNCFSEDKEIVIKKIQRTSNQTSNKKWKMENIGMFFSFLMTSH